MSTQNLSSNCEKCINTVKSRLFIPSFRWQGLGDYPRQHLDIQFPGSIFVSLLEGDFELTKDKFSRILVSLNLVR